VAKAKYEIVEEILSFPCEGEFHTEVNRISWHGNDPKIDIRRWSEGRAKISKGICLTDEEFKKIIEFYGGSINEDRV